MAQIILRNVIVKHNIPVRTQYNITHVIIFYDPKTNNTWCWKTATASALEYKEHCSYSIVGTDEGDFRLSRVNEMSSDRDEGKKSEQDTKPNALDVLLNRVKK